MNDFFSQRRWAELQVEMKRSVALIPDGEARRSVLSALRKIADYVDVEMREIERKYELAKEERDRNNVRGGI